MSIRNCSQCGAPLEADAATCSFCGTAYGSSAPAAGSRHAPVFPFRVDAAGARERVQRHLLGSFASSRSVARAAAAATPERLLQPVWTASAKAESNWTASIASRRGSQPLAGRHDGAYEDLAVLLDPAGAPAVERSEGKPEPWSAARDASLPLLRALSKDEARSALVKHVESQELFATRSFLPGSAARLSANTTVSVLALEPAFRPVWRIAIPSFEWTIDGTTGRVDGPRPRDPIRGNLGCIVLGAVVGLPVLIVLLTAMPLPFQMAAFLPPASIAASSSPSPSAMPTKRPTKTP